MRLSSALRTVALLEAAKGALVLLVGFGLLSLVHQDVQQFAERLVAHAHLNPASHYPRIFLDMANRVTDGRLVLLAAGAALYAGVRFIEAYGLWRARPWAEWFAALGGAIYVPFEVVELYRRVTWLSVGAVVVNLSVVAIMLYCVFHANPENPA
ncbi:MAG: DUF2127 domain-containing protein [Betaproteobacteria bacterium]|nr:MAG: DUF2127 domain-containing protein [Betaproteobacteria bacterium]